MKRQDKSRSETSFEGRSPAGRRSEDRSPAGRRSEDRSPTSRRSKDRSLERRPLNDGGSSPRGYPKAVQQYIDSRGKLRVVGYTLKSASSDIYYFFTLPECPLDKVKRIDHIPLNTYSQQDIVTVMDALDLIPVYRIVDGGVETPNKSASAAAVIDDIDDGEDGDEGRQTIGVVMKSIDGKFSVIRCTRGVYKDLPIAPSHLDFVFPHPSDILTQHRNNKKMANLLMVYAYYSYLSDLNFDEFKKRFVIDKSFDVKPYQVPATPSFDTVLFVKNSATNPPTYDLRVDDESTRQNLIIYVSNLIKKTNITPLTRDSIQATPYDVPDDFIMRESTLVFNDRNSLLRWMRGRGVDRNVIQHTLIPGPKPFYYKNSKINEGEVCIIQNTDTGTLEDAYKVCTEWESAHVNIGSFVDDIKLTKNPSNYSVVNTDGYHVEGKEDGKYIIIKDGERYVPVLPLRLV